MLKVIDGKIYVNNIETNDTELIGNAFKDFAEQLNKNVVFDSDPVYHNSKEWNPEDYNQN